MAGDSGMSGTGVPFSSTHSENTERKTGTHRYRARHRQWNVVPLFASTALSRLMCRVRGQRAVHAAECTALAMNVPQVPPPQLNFQFGCVGRRVGVHEPGVDEVSTGVNEAGVGEMAGARRGRGAQTTRTDEAAVGEADGRGEAGERTTQAQTCTRWLGVCHDRDSGSKKVDEEKATCQCHQVPVPPPNICPLTSTARRSNIRAPVLLPRVATLMYSESVLQEGDTTADYRPQIDLLLFPFKVFPLCPQALCATTWEVLPPSCHLVEAARIWENDGMSFLSPNSRRHLRILRADKGVVLPLSWVQEIKHNYSRHNGRRRSTHLPTPPPKRALEQSLVQFEGDLRASSTSSSTRTTRSKAEAAAAKLPRPCPHPPATDSGSGEKDRRDRGAATPPRGVRTLNGVGGMFSSSNTSFGHEKAQSKI
ncbi:hypothetical protein DFH09DRAFT_1067573 [Mycena vulgaris]|nr:hypothetical protein DFH09DRAFT_1067573 [Mycena vulgaris]